MKFETFCKCLDLLAAQRKVDKEFGDFIASFCVDSPIIVKPNLFHMEFVDLFLDRIGGFPKNFAELEGSVEGRMNWYLSFMQTRFLLPTFVKAIEAIKKERERSELLSKRVEQVFQIEGWCFGYNNEAINVAFNTLLTDEMSDHGDYISYWLYEHEGKTFAWQENGEAKEVDFETSEHLYNFLRNNCN